MNDSLKHFGIKGQKWGVRRFQNADGTWTAEGKERYGKGALDGKQYQRLKKYRDDVDKANEIFYDSKSLNSKYGVSRDKADKMRTKAYRKLDKYGEELVSNFAKNDPDFKNAINERKAAEEAANKEWERISDPKFVESIAKNKKDPRHEWFDKTPSGKYEWGGDGTEYWEQLASKEAQDSLYAAEKKYRASCHKALCKMFSGVMDRPVRKAVREKNPRTEGPWGTEIMRLPVTSRMSDYMQNHFDMINT